MLDPCALAEIVTPSRGFPLGRFTCPERMASAARVGALHSAVASATAPTTVATLIFRVIDVMAFLPYVCFCTSLRPGGKARRADALEVIDNRVDLGGAQKIFKSGHVGTTVRDDAFEFALSPVLNICLRKQRAVAFG